MTSRKPVVCVTGGGTGGHTVAASVIGDIAADRGCEVIWIGRDSSFESRVASSGGHEFVAAPIVRPVRANARPFLASLRRVLAILRRRRPDVVVATGGWVSLPAALGALALRIPLVNHEQTLIPGNATRLFSVLAKETWLTFAESATDLPRPAHPVTTGFPLRPELRRDVSRAEFAAAFGLDPDAPTVFVAGGGSGAESLNGFVDRHLPELLGRWQIVHQVGGAPKLTTNVETLTARRAGLPEQQRGRYWLDEFCSAEQVNLALRGADLVLARAGAAFVNEVVQVGSPAVLVPYPHARHGEQTALAEVVVARGQGWLWPDRSVTADDDAPSLEWLLDVDPADVAKKDLRGHAAQGEPEKLIGQRLDTLLARRART